VIFPESGATKADLIRYHLEAAALDEQSDDSRLLTREEGVPHGVEERERRGEVVLVDALALGGEDALADLRHAALGVADRRDLVGALLGRQVRGIGRVVHGLSDGPRKRRGESRSSLRPCCLHTGREFGMGVVMGARRSAVPARR
jgi:hypothetical protein